MKLAEIFVKVRPDASEFGPEAKRSLSKADAVFREAGKNSGRLFTEALASAASGKVEQLAKKVAAATDAQSAAVGRLRVAQAKLSEVQGNAKAKVSQLAAAEEAVANAQRKANAATSSAESATKQLTTAQAKAKTAAEAVAKAQADAGAQSSKLGGGAGGRFTQAFKSAFKPDGKALDKIDGKREGKGLATRFGVGFNGAFGGIASKSVALLAAAVATAGIGGLIKDSIGLEATFSQTMNTMAAVAKVPANEIKGLSDLALKMGADTTFSAAEAGSAMLELAKGGLSAATIQSGGLAGTLTLAAAGGTDLATASTIASNALNTFGLKGKDMASIAAALAGGANASTASVESLGNALSQVGPGAKTAGLTLQDTVATLAAFDQAGIKGNDAGTSLKTMLTRLVPQTAKAGGAMNDLGLEFTDAAGAFVPITDVAQQLQDKLGGLTAEQKTSRLATIFGSDATRAATVLMNLGAKGLGAYIKATSDQGAATEVAAARMSGTAGAWESFKGSVETAKLQLGLFLAPAVQDGLKKLTEGVNGIVPAAKALAAEFKDNTASLVEFGGWIVKNKDFFIPFAATIGTVIAAVKTWAIVQGILNVVLAANPLGLVVVAIAALVGGLVWAYKNSETFRDVVDGVFKAVVVAGRFMWDNYLKPMFGAFVLIVQGVWQKVQYFGGVFATVFNAIKEPARAALAFVVDQFLGFVGSMITAAAKAFGWVPGLGDKLKGAASAFATFRDSVNAKLSGITDQTINVGIKYSSTGVNLTTPSSVGRRASGGPGGPVDGPGTTTSDTAGVFALSRKEWVIKAKSSMKYGDHAMASVNAGTATIIPNGGFAAGGRPGLNVRTSAPSASLMAKEVAAHTLSLAKPFIQAGAKQLANPTGPGGPPGSVQSFRGERLNTRTIGMLLQAEKILGRMFNIMQGSYSTRVAASGGTHAGGGVMDTDGPGGWSNAQSALRKVGFAAWHRTPAQGPWGHHIHSVAIGDPTASAAAKSQVKDYLRGGDGLSGGMHKGGLVGGFRKSLEFDGGGRLPTGTSTVVNNTGKPEPLTRTDQAMDLSDTTIRALSKAFAGALSQGKFQMVNRGNGAYVLQASNS